MPTVAETFSGYELAGWHAIFAPAKTDASIVQTLAAEFHRITRGQGMVDRLKEDSLEGLGGTPAELQQVINREQKVWGQTIKARNIRLD